MGFPARRRDRPNESQVSPRAEWYDRNPSKENIGYQGWHIAPHSETIRSQYTVPTGKKAFIGGAYASVLRYTVATLVGTAVIYLGIGAEPLVVVEHLNNTVGIREWGLGLPSSVMLEGDNASIKTADPSNGGLMDYQAGIAIMEFDA